MKIMLVGHGNVAWHLYRALCAAGHEVMEVSARDIVAGSSVGDCDSAIVAVCDNYLPDVIRAMADFPEEGSSGRGRRVLLHTSGSIGLEVFDAVPESRRRACGVLYPLQTFTKGVALDFRRVPLLVEGCSAEAEKVAKELAATLSDKVLSVNSETRRKLHLAAVVACNFANHLWALADEYLKQENLDLSLLYPLLEETLSKAKRIGPAPAQTGPASRGDSKVVDSHLRMLADDRRLADIYRLLSQSIMDSYQKFE